MGSAPSGERRLATAADGSPINMDDTVLVSARVLGVSSVPINDFDDTGVAVLEIQGGYLDVNPKATVRPETIVTVMKKDAAA